MHQASGFTVIEILLVTAVLSVLAGFALPIAQTLQINTDLDAAITLSVQALRRAQTLSQAQDGDMSWGVSFASGAITLFRGNTFAGRDPSFDEVIPISDTILLSGSTEMVFTKLDGLPRQTGSLTFIGSNNETRTLTINAKGMVDY